MDDGGLASRAPAEAGPREGELALLCLPVVDQRPGLSSSQLDLGGEAQHLPELSRPGAGRRDDRLALEPSIRGDHRLHPVGAELETRHLDALGDAGPRGARSLGQVPHGLHRIRTAPPALVEDALDGRLPIWPGPGQVLAAACPADHEL